MYLKNYLINNFNVLDLFYSKINYLNYFNLLLIFIIAFVFGFILFFVSLFLSKKKIDYEKLSPYECGFDPFESAHIRLNIHYYIISILFLIFDLELAYLFPWVINSYNISVFGFFMVLFFLFLLLLGFIYEYKKGALIWVTDDIKSVLN